MSHEPVARFRKCCPRVWADRLRLYSHDIDSSCFCKPGSLPGSSPWPLQYRLLPFSYRQDIGDEAGATGLIWFAPDVDASSSDVPSGLRIDDHGLVSRGRSVQRVSTVLGALRLAEVVRYESDGKRNLYRLKHPSEVKGVLNALSRFGRRRRRSGARHPVFRSAYRS
jgi:hypothetical protein